MSVEVWLARTHKFGLAEAWAEATEAEGVDGLSFGDTQHLALDPFVGLSLAAKVTSNLKLQVGVTNPVNRHPAITANSILTVHAVSGGRATLGLGRGDSAVTYLGIKAPDVPTTRRFVERLQTYLSGGYYPDDNELSPIRWEADLGLAKVPLDIAASGPQMIELGATLGDKVAFNVGALPERIEWAVKEARAANPSVTSLGAYITVAAHDDPQVARDLARGPLGAYARFTGMPGNPKMVVTAEDRGVIEKIASGYDILHHASPTGPHMNVITDEFVERYAAVGTPKDVVARLSELASLGIERFLFLEGKDANNPAVQDRAHRHLVEEVVPALHELG